MGYRMISFLTECLPSHPGFRSPEVFESRMQCRRELELVQKCLDDIALRIDEDQCNLFADGFDPIVDDSDDDSVSESATENWVAFGGWTDDELKTKPRKADSPTNTVATSGTGSVDAYDFSSSDESGDAERQLDFSEYCEESSSPRPLYTMDLGTDFLERIAREDVRYETDSDAADSWAQDNASVAPSASSASGITCDPARLAFRELLNRVPRIKLVKKRRDLRVRQNVDKNTIDESAVDSEIQKYLESEDQKEDPYDVIENSLERLKHSSQSKSPERDERSESSGSSDLASTFEQKEVEPKTGQSEFVLEAEDEWVSFDIGRQPVQF